MIKPINVDNENVISMSKMKPFDIGKVVSGAHSGNIVMRTASLCYFEIMCLSAPGPNSCWTDEASSQDIKVKLFTSGEKFCFEVV